MFSTETMDDARALVVLRRMQTVPTDPRPHAKATQSWRRGRSRYSASLGRILHAEQQQKHRVVRTSSCDYDHIPRPHGLSYVGRRAVLCTRLHVSASPPPSTGNLVAKSPAESYVPYLLGGCLPSSATSNRRGFCGRTGVNHPGSKRQIHTHVIQQQAAATTGKMIPAHLCGFLSTIVSTGSTEYFTSVTASCNVRVR